MKMIITFREIKKNLSLVSTSDIHFQFGSYTLTLTNGVITPTNGQNQIKNNCT